MRERRVMADDRTVLFDLKAWGPWWPTHHPAYDINGLVRDSWPLQKRYEFASESIKSAKRGQWNPFEHYLLDASSLVPARFSTHAFGLYVTGVYTYYGYVSPQGLHAGYIKDPLYLWHPGRVTHIGEPGEPTIGLTPLYERTADVQGHKIPWPAAVSTLKQRSLDAMLPKVKAELSLLNSMIELKDFRSLPRTIANIRNLTKRSGATLRRILRGGSDAYLQAQFNILPLLSDICGLHAALSRSEKRIRASINRSMATQRRHFSCWLPSDDNGIQETTQTVNYSDFLYSPNLQCSVKFYRRSFFIASEFHAQLDYNYNYSRFQIEHARLLALLDEMGLNLNPSIIWNAIPWSFVVDWVIGVSRFLDRLKTMNMEPTINIRRYLYSVRRVRVISMTMTSPAEYPFLEPYRCISPLPAVTESSYRRDTELPTTSSILSSGLSLKEFSLGAALVFSRGKRHPRRWRKPTSVK